MKTPRILSLLLALLLLCVGIGGQQPVYARNDRSIYGAPSPAFGWNTIGSFNPISLGQMSKDELLELLEAWREVEEADAKPEPEPPAPKPKPEQPKPTARPRPPAPAAQPDPAPAATGPDAASGPGPGGPVTVRLPAFVPIQLQAMFTPPAAGGGAGGAGAFAGAGSGTGSGIDSAVSGQDGPPRLFRFMQLPPSRTRTRSPPSPAAKPVMRNTLESVDTGIAPLANLVKVNSQSANFGPQVREAPQMTNVRPRFAVAPPPPFLANAPGPLELVPSSQIFGDWRE